MRFRGITILLFVCLLAMPALAQEQGGSIQGVVKDSQGGVLPGVTVEARSPQVVGVSTAITNTEGIYRFPALPPGNYEITASLQGFNSAKSAAMLVLGQLLRIDITLSVAGVVETIQVTAESPLIDVKQNATFATVQADTIARIPKGRDFTGVIAMAAGANDEARTGGISVQGASGSENRFVVDGLDTTDLKTGVTGKTVVNDFIQEVQVKTSGYNAEFGGATGGVVSAITKSGSNQFRGVAGFYFTNNGPTGLANKDKSNFFKGKQRPSLRLKPTNTREAELYTVPLNDSPDYQPVFDLGGPIVRDRLWFYAGYAPVRTSSARTVTFTSAPADGSDRTKTYKRDDPIDRLNANLSTQLTNSMRVRFSYAPQWTRQRGSLPANIEPDGTSTSNPNTDYLSVGGNSWNDAYSGTLDWSLTNTLFLNVMGGYFVYDNETLGSGTAIVHSMAGNISDFPEVPASFIQPSGYVDGKSSYKTAKNEFNRLYVNASTTWFKSFGGQHTIKGGVRYERIGNDVYQGNIEPTITFNWNSTYNMNDGSGSRAGKYGWYNVSKGVVRSGDIYSDNWSLFLQDSWSPSSRLTFNYGVRAESEQVPYYSEGAKGKGLDFGFGSKIAPRVGFAYDIKGDGKWKAYGSFGRYFDITKLELPQGSFGGEKWISYAWSLDTYDWKSINCQEGQSGCPGTFYEQTIWRFGSNEVDPTIDDVRRKYFGTSGNWIDPEIKPVQSQAIVAGIDRELTSILSLGARYTHTWVTRTIEDFGWNEPGLGEFYIIGNPGDGAWGNEKFLWGPDKLYKTGSFVPMPKPIRKYDAMEITVRKRLANRWSGQLVYTYSRLWGNFPGLASSDEGGRTSPNVNRMYDAIWMMYDTTGSKKEVLGRLNTDRPHYVKAQFTYDMPWGTSVGVNWSARTGALYSHQLSYQGYSPTFFKGRGSLGRTPVEQFVDLLVQHDFRFGKRYVMNLSVNALNLLDADTATAIFASPYRDRITLSPVESFFNGFDAEGIMNANPTSYRPDARFKMASAFMGRRDVRIGASFRF